jgi:para-nitrobenzyl esterase
VGVDNDARTLSRAMREAWVAFAATGDPSTERLGRWPAYDPDRRPTMILGRQPGLVDDPRGAVRRAWAQAKPGSV